MHSCNCSYASGFLEHFWNLYGDPITFRLKNYRVKKKIMNKPLAFNS